MRSVREPGESAEEGRVHDVIVEHAGLAVAHLALHLASQLHTAHPRHHVVRLALVDVQQSEVIGQL